MALHSHWMPTGAPTPQNPAVALRYRASVSELTDAQLAEIATTKLADLNTADIDAAKKQVAGTARSMGIKVAG